MLDFQTVATPGTGPLAVSSSVQYCPLKYQRLLRGWSQQDIVDYLSDRCNAEGKSVGISVNLVSRWETGKSKPSPLYRKHLCLLFGLTAQQLGWI